MMMMMMMMMMMIDGRDVELLTVSWRSRVSRVSRRRRAVMLRTSDGLDAVRSRDACIAVATYLDTTRWEGLPGKKQVQLYEPGCRSTATSPSNLRHGTARVAPRYGHGVKLRSNV
jgi:hypothetical protein